MSALNRQAILFAVCLTLALFVTGLASVPWANQFPPMVQNVLYALGRLHVIYVLALVFLGTKNEA